MASSTTKPIASTSASKVNRLMVKPMIKSIINVEISDTGTVTAGTSIERMLPKNR